MIISLSLSFIYIILMFYFVALVVGLQCVVFSEQSYGDQSSRGGADRMRAGNTLSSTKDRQRFMKCPLHTVLFITTQSGFKLWPLVKLQFVLYICSEADIGSNQTSFQRKNRLVSEIKPKLQSSFFLRVLACLNIWTELKPY